MNAPVVAGESPQIAGRNVVAIVAIELIVVGPTIETISPAVTHEACCRS